MVTPKFYIERRDELARHLCLVLFNGNGRRLVADSEKELFDQIREGMVEAGVEDELTRSKLNRLLGFLCSRGYVEVRHPIEFVRGENRRQHKVIWRRHYV